MVARLGGRDFRHVALSMADGTSVSLRRYLHRWLVLWVTDDPGAAIAPPRFHDGAFRIAVLVGETPAGPLSGSEATTLYGCTGELAAMFPDLAWPATFLVNPEGRLVAIVEGDDRAGLIRQFLYSVPQPYSGGAIDLGDISG